MASSQSFSMIQRRMLLSPWPASPVNSDEPLWTSAMRLPRGVSWFIFDARLARKSIWPSLERVTRGGDLLAARDGEFDEGFLGGGEHSARANGAVVEQVSAGSDGIGDGEKDQHRHQADGVAGRPVFAGFLVVFFVEPADQLLED